METDSPPRHPPYGLLSTIGLVVASMIGAGVFTTSGFALADLENPWLVLGAWLVGGVVALCGAVCYASLARFHVESGGEYLFLARTIHPLAGFVAGWVSLLAGFTGAIAFAATAFEQYALPDGGRPAWLPPNVLAVGVILLCTLLHGVRTRPGAWLQNCLVTGKLVLLSGFLLFGGLKLANSKWELVRASGSPTSFSLISFATSLMWISLSYCGFNAAVYVTSEVSDAQRVVPKALILGTLVVTGLYLGLNAVFLFASAPEMIAGQADVAAIAAQALGGPWLAGATRVIISLALLTSVSAMVMSGPRVYSKMADDGLLPDCFRFQGELPRFSVLFQAGLAIIVVCLSGLSELLSYLGFTLSLSSALAVSSLFLLRRRLGATEVPIPGYPFVPILFVGATTVFALLAVIRRPWECAIGATTLAAGVLVYFLIPRASEGTQPKVALESIEHTNKRETKTTKSTWSNEKS